MIKSFPANDVLPSKAEIKTEILHLPVELLPSFEKPKFNIISNNSLNITQTSVTVKIILSMEASLFKWVSLFSIGCFFSIQTFFSDSFTASPLWRERGPHPFHISTTEINYNAINKTLEISCRVFINDFESALSKVYHIKADLTAPGMKTAMDKAVKKYITSHLQIKTDGNTGLMKYLGFEKEEEAVYAYFEVKNIAAVKKADITNSILYDLYDDQLSIIHVIVDGNRKSTRLDYPDKQVVFSF